MSASREKKQRQGSGMPEKVSQAQQEQAAYKRKVRTYTAIGVVVVVLVAALLIWNSNFFQSRATAATIGDESLSVSELSFYYYDARYIYAYYGILDTSKSDAEQIYDEESEQSYRDFFLESALANAQTVTALYNEAVKNGYTDSQVQDDLNDEISSLKASASAENYSYGAYLKAMYGRYMTPSAFKSLRTKALVASLYATDKQLELSQSFTEEDLQAYYDEHPDDFDTFEYSYLYFKAETVEETDEDGNELSEDEIEALKTEAMEKAKEQAETALAAYKDGTLIAKLITEYEPSSSGDHTTATGVSSINSNFRDELLELAADEAAMVEYTDNGYYVVVYHNRSRNEDLTADIRHILVRAETTLNDEDEVVAPTDEAWAAAEEKAQQILAEFEAGEQTADAFAALANQHSEDGGSNTTGGLYSKIARTDSYVPEFLEWIFDEDEHQAGDTGIVRHEGDVSSSSSYWGYHVMFFQGWNEAEWAADVRSTMTSEASTEWEESVVNDETYPTALQSGADRLGN